VGNFIHHISGGVFVGAACGYSAYAHYGLQAEDALAAGVFCCVGSLLPDIDSEQSKPNEMMFGIASIILPMMAIQSFGGLAMSPSRLLVIGLGVYAAVRYGAKMLMQKVVVHRGIFHSIPMAFLWAALVYLAYRHTPSMVKNVIASSALIGFIVHLMIDEMFSFVNFEGMRIEPKQSLGTALKFVAPSSVATMLCYCCVGWLLWLCVKDAKLL
jgi:membrane-bound metal-dependent hydrolase YbcI (DUF457 family)